MNRFARWSATRGQATVELVALLPLLLLIGAVAFHVLAAGRAEEAAEGAAEAGAVALLQDGDPADAARSALVGWSRSHTRVRVRGRRVEVTVRPRSPLAVVTKHFTARAIADAGPVPATTGPPAPARGGDGASGAVP
jgi:hypothetical protein